MLLLAVLLKSQKRQLEPYPISVVAITIIIIRIVCHTNHNSGIQDPLRNHLTATARKIQMRLYGGFSI